MFCHAVYENIYLTKVKRYHYLETPRSGPTAKVIEGIQTTAASNGGAVEILKIKFGNSKVIEQRHLANLGTLRPFKSSGNVAALRSLLDNVKINVRRLKALGLPEVSYAAMLFEVLNKAILSGMIVEYRK